MSAEVILAQVQQFLSRAINEPVGISDAIIDEFGERCKTALRRQFNEPPRKFSLQMSNVGRPLCQLQREAAGDRGEQPGYNMKFRNLLGDVIEAAAIAVLRAADVGVEQIDQRLKLPIGGISLGGVFDIKINGRVYDIKSASPYSFKHKFSRGYQAIAESDDFGYVAQGYTYSAADGSPFGGWIAVNKATGEWTITEVPQYFPEKKTEVLNDVDRKIHAITEGAPFEKCFTDEPEMFRKKLTGNRTLSRICSMCNFRGLCWPEAQLKPQANSKAINPKLVWYTVYNDNDTTSRTNAGSGGSELEEISVKD